MFHLFQLLCDMPRKTQLLFEVANATESPERQWQLLRGIYKRVIKTNRQTAIESWFNKEADSIQKKCFKYVLKGIFGFKWQDYTTDHPLYESSKICFQIYASDIVAEDYQQAAIFWLCCNPDDKEKFIAICSSISNAYKRLASTYQEQYPSHKNALVAVGRHQAAQEGLQLSVLPMSRNKRNTYSTLGTTVKEHKQHKKVILADVSHPLPLGSLTNDLVAVDQLAGDRLRDVNYTYDPPWARIQLGGSNTTEFKEAFARRPFAIATDDYGAPTSARRRAGNGATATVGTISGGSLDEEAVRTAIPSNSRKTGSSKSQPSRPHLTYLTTYHHSFMNDPELLSTQRATRHAQPTKKEDRACPWDCQAQGYTTDALLSTYKRELGHAPVAGGSRIT
eukprot:TRINITY_DN5768_c0_g1_i1.p1 TRINITY_DN5768_c0_g1~~TRINITY_DN5768_c0_g1_i1.p1  ORF type:complete len:393 (-),score=45.53 TRINITY_DN5768_c0_g1_i1:7-1185(-)